MDKEGGRESVARFAGADADAGAAAADWASGKFVHMTHAAAAGQKILRFCLHFVQLFLKRWGNKQNQTKQWNRQREKTRKRVESGER